MSDRTILVWFRNDLRIHDNEILSEAVRKADKILPVYVFDPYYFTTSASGQQKTGSFRAKFLLESVADLRKNLREHFNAELIIRTGNPAEVLPQLAEEYSVSEVYHHREVAPEETNISEQVEAALWKMKLNLKHFIGHTLYHKEDLPFPIKDIPDSFVTFKKKVERDSTVRPCTLAPEHITTPAITNAGELPTLADLGLTEQLPDMRARYTFTGGETAAIGQLARYFEAGDGKPNSSGLSAWLALGCISPRRVYWEVIKHHNHDPLLLELLWRDYFRFMFKKHGQQYFMADTAGVSADEAERFDRWQKGQTGEAFVDAVMHELNSTGYINNFSRQAIATYLVNNMHVNWTKGAYYFEQKLIDYSPASNWGNWAFVAGIGNDAKSARLFVAAKPIGKLDDSAEYVAKWSSQQALTKASA